MSDRLTETELFALRQLEKRKADLLRGVEDRLAPDYRAFSALVETRLGLEPGWSVSAVTGEITPAGGKSDQERVAVLRQAQDERPAPTEHLTEAASHHRPGRAPNAPRGERPMREKRNPDRLNFNPSSRAQNCWLWAQ